MWLRASCWIFFTFCGSLVFSQAQSVNEKAMLKEINLVRTNPKGYVKYIDAFVERLGQDSIRNYHIKN